jgi:hypothetical protein
MAKIDLAKAKAQRTFDVLNEIHERGLHRQNGWTARYDLQLLLEHWSSLAACDDRTISPKIDGFDEKSCRERLKFLQQWLPPDVFEMAPRSTLEASVLNPSLERLTQSRRSEFVAEIAAADALRKWSSSESVDELLAVLHARLHNERSVFTTTADLHLIDAAYARATQRISSGLQKAAPLVVDGIDEEQCKHRVDTLRRTLRLAGRVDRARIRILSTRHAQRCPAC